MILLDTNVLSELIRPGPSPRVVAWLAANEPLLALPAIALAELRYGIARLLAGRRKSSLLRFWRMTCERFRGRIFSVERHAHRGSADHVDLYAGSRELELPGEVVEQARQLFPIKIGVPIHWCLPCAR